MRSAPRTAACMDMCAQFSRCHLPTVVCECAQDAYSFGLVMYEVLTWRLAWEDFPPWQVCMHTASSLPAGLPCRAMRVGPGFRLAFSLAPSFLPCS